MGSLSPNIPEDLCLKAQNGFGKSSILLSYLNKPP